MSNLLEEMEKNGAVPSEVSEMLLKISKLQVADVFTDAEASLIVDALAALAVDGAIKKGGSPMRKRGEKGDG